MFLPTVASKNFPRARVSDEGGKNPPRGEIISALWDKTFPVEKAPLSSLSPGKTAITPQIPPGKDPNPKRGEKVGTF